MKIQFVIIIILCLKLNISAQSKGTKIVQVRIYAVSCNSFYRSAHTISNLKKTHIYFFKNKEADLDKMFIDYKDCVEKLSSRKQYFSSDSTKKFATRLLAELHFDNKKIVSVFFDNMGNYYFQNSWHVKNDGLYYLLFKYLSDDVIPNKVFEESKKKFQDEFWHED